MDAVSIRSSLTSRYLRISIILRYASTVKSTLITSILIRRSPVTSTARTVIRNLTRRRNLIRVEGVMIVKLLRFHRFYPHNHRQAVALCPTCGEETFINNGGTRELVKGNDAEAKCRKCNTDFTVEPLTRREK